MSKIFNSWYCMNFPSFKNNIRFSKLTFLKKTKVRVKGLGNKIVTVGRVNLKNLKIEINGNNNELTIQENVRFYENGYLLIEGNNCNIHIGQNSTVGSAHIFCAESDTSIKIGKDCMLSRGVKISTGDFHSIIDLTTNRRINKSLDIMIGDHVWIGSGAVINKGVIISNNSIVGLNSVVTKKFSEENLIIAGTPAKIISQNVNWDRRKLSFD